MRRLIIATVLSLPAAASFAGNYCDYKKTSAEVTRCYNAAIEQAKYDHDKVVQRGMSSPNLSAANKRLLKEDTQDFINKVNSQCRSHACIFNSLVERQRIVTRFIQQNSQPAAQTNKR